MITVNTDPDPDPDANPAEYSALGIFFLFRQMGNPLLTNFQTLVYRVGK
jgi:hypothetical protein